VEVPKIIESHGWRSALRELALIVVGVSIALAAGAWYDERRERADEREILDQLAVALRVDRDELSSRYQTEHEVTRDVRAVLDHLESGAPYDPDAGLNFGAVRRWVGVRASTAPYEALKSRGFDLIRDDSLRLRLIYYYENEFPVLQDAYLNDRQFVTDLVYPYFHVHFHSPNRGTIQLPIDYEELSTDPVFANLLVTKLVRLEDRLLPYYEAALALIDELLNLIADERQG
jgi:hypothetical protein